MKQATRKWIISLKRRPQNIPMALLVICCCLYTFHLTAHSNASMYVSSRIIALYVFIITLCSILTIFSFVNLFAKGRKKKRGFMRFVVYLMIGAQLLFDVLFLQIMIYETSQRENPVPLTTDIAASMNWTLIHLGALIFTLLVILTLPLLHKLILRIDTKTEDEVWTEIAEEKLVDEEEIL